MKQTGLNGFQVPIVIAEPYRIPEGWRWSELEEVSEINPSKREIRDLPDDLLVSFVPMAGVDEKKGEITEADVRVLGDVRQGYTYIGEGDVIFAKITPCMENGKCAIAKNLVNGLGFGSTEFHVIRPTNLIQSEWIWYYVRQEVVRREAARQFTGSVGHQRVPKEFLMRLPIPVPPIFEQERVVSRLRGLNNKIQKARGLLNETSQQSKDLVSSALNEIFSESDERGWNLIELGGVLSDVQSGFACSKKHETGEDGTPHLRPNNIGFEGEIDLSKLTYLPRDMVDLSKYSPKRGDVLFNNTNSKELVGRAAFVREDLECGFSNHITRLRANENLLDPKWLVLSINYLWLQGYFLRISRKWIGQAGVNTRMMRSAEVFLPPLGDQELIVDRIEKLFSKMNEIKSSQEEVEKDLRLLEWSILNEAFRGEL